MDTASMQWRATNPYDPGQRAVGGGLLGAGAGAAIGPRLVFLLYQKGWDSRIFQA